MDIGRRAWEEPRRQVPQNAASSASLMLTTEALVCEIPEKKEPMPGGHGPDMDY